MKSHKWKLPLWVVLIIIGGILVLRVKSFLSGDGLSVSAIEQVGIWTASAMFVWWAWHQFKLSRKFDWIARHSPLRKVPKTMAIVIVSAVIFFMLTGLTVLVLKLIDADPKEPSLTYSEFKSAVVNKKIGEYIILKKKEKIMGNPRQIAFFIDLNDGLKKWTWFEEAPPSIPFASPQDWLDQRGHNVELQDSFPLGNILMQTLQGVAMTVPVFFLMWIFIGGGMRTMGEELSTLRASKRLLGETVTFKDVAGIDPVIESLKSYTNYLSDPKRYKALLAKIPKGVLLHGPPGVGKTLVARAVAGETGVPTFKISGSDFHFAFVGVGAARAESLFEHAIRNAPSIVIVDEIDSAGSKRGGADFGGAGKERDALVNKLNSILDRLSNEDIPVIVFGTTNLVESLDSALIRPGRFDRHVYVPAPDAKGRAAILGVHLINPDPKLIADDVDLTEVARRTRGWSGAGLATLANEARIKGVEEGDGKQVHQKNILEAWEFVLFGPETVVDLLDAERKKISYHESAHAIASLVLPESDPSEYVTMRTHSTMLGHAFPLAEREYHVENKTRMLTRIKVFLAGHAVEMALYGESSTAAKKDVENATEFASRIVFEGMDEEIGPVAIKNAHPSQSLGQFGGHQSILAQEGEKRVQAILKECEKEMRDFFAGIEGKKVLEDVVEKLRAEKTLTRAQLEEIIPKELLERRTAGA
ncbi:MAG: AAA family ATPase [Candidatus Spechtbacterales bacterium]